MKDTILKQINESVEVKKLIATDPVMIRVIEDVAVIMVAAFNRGNKIMIAGNGGSAADAQHMAGELVSRFYFDRPGLPAIALTTDSSVLTSIANDDDYRHVFARQIQALGRKEDVFIGISTSGNSANIIEALKTCRQTGIYTIGLTGKKTGTMSPLCDYLISVPSGSTPRIQEAHLLIEHILCGLAEEKIFRK